MPPTRLRLLRARAATTCSTLSAAICCQRNCRCVPVSTTCSTLIRKSPTATLVPPKPGAPPTALTTIHSVAVTTLQWNLTSDAALDGQIHCLLRKTRRRATSPPFFMPAASQTPWVASDKSATIARACCSIESRQERQKLQEPCHAFEPTQFLPDLFQLGVAAGRLAARCQRARPHCAA